MTDDKLKAIDFLILASIVNSSVTYEDILLMVTRFTNMRDYIRFSLPHNIQNPPSETKKEYNK